MINKLTVQSDMLKPYQIDTVICISILYIYYILILYKTHKAQIIADIQQCLFAQNFIIFGLAGGGVVVAVHFMSPFVLCFMCFYGWTNNKLCFHSINFDWLHWTLCDITKRYIKKRKLTKDMRDTRVNCEGWNDYEIDCV